MLMHEVATTRRSLAFLTSRVAFHASPWIRGRSVRVARGVPKKLDNRGTGCARASNSASSLRKDSASLSIAARSAFRRPSDDGSKLGADKFRAIVPKGESGATGSSLSLLCLGERGAITGYVNDLKGGGGSSPSNLRRGELGLLTWSVRWKLPVALSLSRKSVPVFQSSFKRVWRWSGGGGARVGRNCIWAWSDTMSPRARVPTRSSRCWVTGGDGVVMLTAFFLARRSLAVGFLGVIAGGGGGHPTSAVFDTASLNLWLSSWPNPG